MTPDDSLRMTWPSMPVVPGGPSGRRCPTPNRLTSIGTGDFTGIGNTQDNVITGGTGRDTLLGLVFFGSLAFLLWATVNLTDLSVDNVRIKVFFAQAGGQPATQAAGTAVY